MRLRAKMEKYQTDRAGVFDVFVVAIEAVEAAVCFLRELKAVRLCMKRMRNSLDMQSE